MPENMMTYEGDLQATSELDDDKAEVDGVVNPFD